MLRKSTQKQVEETEPKKMKMELPEISPFVQLYQNPPHFYPFGPERGSYPSNFPTYGYAPPAMPNYYGHPYFPSYPYPTFSYPPALPSEIKKSQKKIKKEVIDLDSPPIVKTETREEAKPCMLSKRCGDAQSRMKTKNEAVNRFEDYFTDKYTLKTNNLQIIFKTMLLDFVSENPNAEETKKRLVQSLRLQNEWKLNKAFCDSLFNTICVKFETFKKTKEEIIKYIIRRTYHNAKHHKSSIFKTDFDKLQNFHERNLTIHKSMNSDFLKKEFSNRLFVTIYKEFLEQMDEQFQRENDERVTRFAITLASAWIEKTITMVQYQKKLPWIHSYKLKIRKIAFELLQSYEECCNSRVD